MPRAKRPLCNRQFLIVLIPRRGARGWICCINNSIPFQRKPEEGKGISSITFHDRSALMCARAAGIRNIFESPSPVRFVVTSEAAQRATLMPTRRCTSAPLG